MRDINSLNKVLLIGHLGQNPELRYLPQTERPVARFTLATNERSFNPTTNETREYTQWHRVVAWGKLAEFCDKYLIQGRQIYIEGKLRTRSWQDREGNKRYTTEVNAQNIVLLGKREPAAEEERTESQMSDAEFPSEEKSANQHEDKDDSEDEVPF